MLLLLKSVRLYFIGAFIDVLDFILNKSIKCITAPKLSNLLYKQKCKFQAYESDIKNDIINFYRHS